jgi:hypothetical protein
MTFLDSKKNTSDGKTRKETLSATRLLWGNVGGYCKMTEEAVDRTVW